MQNQRFIDLENSKAQTYKLAANDFIHFSIHEFETMFGSAPPKLNDEVPMIGAITQESSKKSVDWRKRGMVSKVKNQGKSCDACYAFVAVADI